MYKLFINNKVIFLLQNPAHIENLIQEEYIIEPYLSKENFQSILSVILNNDNKNNIVLYGNNIQRIFNEICEFFICIEAAGGVVQNKQDEILLIFRRGSWDLPKGKIEMHETTTAAAIREVEEETGLKNVTIVQPISFKKLHNKATYHSYFLKEQLALKISYWFLMKVEKSDNVIPQTEEDIEQVVWVKKQDIPNYYNNMYPSIIDVLKEII